MSSQSGNEGLRWTTTTNVAGQTKRPLKAQIDCPSHVRPYLPPWRERESARARGREREKKIDRQREREKERDQGIGSGIED